MDTLTRSQRSIRMGLIKGRDTEPELSFGRLLHSLGYRYRKCVSDLPGRPDFVLFRCRKAIFVHGCFWHAHSCSLGRLPKSKLDFWKPKLVANRRRDQRVVRKLRSEGWGVLIVWECQLRNLDGLTNRVRGFVDA